MTVEESLVVSMQDLRNQLHHGAAGRFSWRSSTSGGTSSVGYNITWGDVPAVTLHYRWRGTEDVVIPVRLEMTPMPFAVQRWWFSCPLTWRGMPCLRLVGKLYLPPGARRFGCRECHDLSYRSCQEAHQLDCVFGRLGVTAEIRQELMARCSGNE